MTEPRHTADTINDDALDALYEQLEAAEQTESQRQLATAREALASATIRAARAEAERDGAYRERAHLVAHLAALHPSHIGYTDPNAVDWLVVTIETPTGQMSWHIAERDRDLFEHVRLVPAVHSVWDGHTTEEKYGRLRALTASALPLIFGALGPGLGDTAATEPEDEWTGSLIPAPLAEAIRQADADTSEPHTGLVVQPYTENGEQKWVFRCWGTDTCDGWLSLDHYSQQSAERARDRHVTEEHPTEEQPGA